MIQNKENVKLPNDIDFLNSKEILASLEKSFENSNLFIVGEIHGVKLTVKILENLCHLYLQTVETV